MRDTPKRVTWLAGILAVALLLLVAQLYRLTVVQSATWQHEAEENMLRSLVMPGPRGSIYDRNGKPLATSEPAYAAVLVDQNPERVAQFLPDLALLLAAGNEEKAQRIIESVTERVREREESLTQYEPIVIERLNQTVLATFMERRHEFPGVEIVTDSIRQYPEKSLAGAVMGYVGAISQEMLDQPEFADYSGNEIVGRDGLERYWEKELQGKPGSKVLVVDWLGKPVGGYKLIPPEPGHDLVLTLDAELQRVAETALEKQIEYIRTHDTAHSRPVRGSLVAVDVRTGAVLAMASYPTYDPNILAQGVTEAQWQALINQPGSPLVNAAIMGFAPGSTYKMATGLAGLESGKLGPYEQIPCPAGIWFGGRFWKNWTGYDQGPGDVARALAMSCNPFFWEVGQRLGMDGLADFISQFGFGQPTGIDLWGEEGGNLPTKASYGERYNEGDNLNVAIGQGDVLVTPLQLADYVATIANSGVRHRPYLVQQVRDSIGQVLFDHQPVDPGRVNASAENWERIQHGMWLGAHAPEGTATLPFTGFPIDVAAKTGSAETGSGFAHALSVAYAPFDKPEIAVSVIVEGGGTGSWTTPIIRRVMAQYFGIKDVIPGAVPTYRD